VHRTEILVAPKPGKQINAASQQNPYTNNPILYYGALHLQNHHYHFWLSILSHAMAWLAVL